jgi:hypothetical protein
MFLEPVYFKELFPQVDDFRAFVASSNQIKCYLSHVPNTTGVVDLTVK